VDLKNFFYGHQIKNATEMSLSANQVKSNMRKSLEWKVEGQTSSPQEKVRRHSCQRGSLQRFFSSSRAKANGDQDIHYSSDEVTL
jgi:hypothetical protein